MAIPMQAVIRMAAVNAMIRFFMVPPYCHDYNNRS
jgi:hypothetical protein